jgi:phosphoglycolate phosphatase
VSPESDNVTADGHDGLIFDLDGTLWDSTAPVAVAWNRAMQRLGRGSQPISDQDIAGIMGMPHHKIFETIFPGEKHETREEIARECYEQEIETLRKQGAALYPGVAAGLAKLAERYPLFVVSNCQTDYLETFFGCTGFDKLFRDHECHGGTGLSKGENIKLVVERNALRQPAYIGDTGSDQEAATRAGVIYYHVDYGFGEPVRDCLRFRNFEELVKHFA